MARRRKALTAEQMARGKRWPTGSIRLVVADLMRRKGMVSSKGRRPGQPNVSALMHGAGLAYATAFDLVRHPNRVQRLDLGTMERLCRVLNCTPGELFAYDPQVAPRPRPKPVRNPLEHGPYWLEHYLGWEREPASP